MPGIVVRPFPTFEGTASLDQATPEYVILPTINFLDQFYDDADDGLATAAAQVNTLPRDVSQVLPMNPNAALFFGQTRWIVSGVSLQELLGRNLSQPAIHAMYGVYISIFLAVLYITIRIIVTILRVFLWVIITLKKLIPFIG